MPGPLKLGAALFMLVLIVYVPLAKGEPPSDVRELARVERIGRQGLRFDRAYPRRHCARPSSSASARAVRVIRRAYVFILSPRVGWFQGFVCSSDFSLGRNSSRLSLST